MPHVRDVLTAAGASYVWQACRAAIDRQIELDRLKRTELEKCKQAELAGERQGLAEWQQQLPVAAQGDESDYESENGDVGIVNPTTDAAGSGGADAAMPDHPHYHGKGWWPSSATASAGQQEGGGVSRCGV